MRIENTVFQLRSSKPFNSLNKKNEDNYSPYSQINVYNPPAYRDFHICFGERLFRTPANFFEFNKNRLPDTMMEYLNEDFEDRQNMPPIQMWKTVFEDLHNAKDFDEVKALYRDEPLFANLKNYEGRANDSLTVVGQIQALSSEFDKTPLFKDGSSDFGMYLLKKVYYDGKSVKEINKDFKKDINDEYKGLIDKDVNNNTTRAYGIKFPNVGFWNSFIVTRDDFPYTYKPRKEGIRRTSGADVDRNNFAKPNTSVPKAKSKFGSIKDWQVDKITDAVIKSTGSPKKFKDRLKQTNIKDDDALNFTAKYFKEINLIVLDRLHASEEMRNYFESYDDLSKSQQEKFAKYWQNPELNRIQSTLMKDTIKLFMDTYGVDGENEEFKALIDYSKSIRTNRLERQKQHDLLQAEYDRALGIQEVVPEPAEVVEERDKVQDLNQILDDVKKEYDVESYDFEIDGNQVTIVGNLKEAIAESLVAKNLIFPKAFLNNYVNFVQNSALTTPDYVLSLLLSEKGINLPDDPRLMKLEKVEDTTLQLYQDFTDAKPSENKAAHQAVVDAFLSMTKEDITPEIFRLGVFEISDLYAQISPEQKQFLLSKSDLINKNYSEYRKPLTDTEARKIAINIFELLRKYNPHNTIIKSPSPFRGYDSIIAATREMVLGKSKVADNLKDALAKYLKTYGGSAKFLLDKNVPESLRMAKLEEFICAYAYDKQGELLTFVAVEPRSMEYLKNHDLKMYTYLRNELLTNQYFNRR